MKGSRILGYAGRALVTAGVLVLLFVVFQLWGTGLHEAQAQDSLTRQFDRMLARSTAPSTSTGQPGPTTTLPAKVAASKDIAPKIGEPVGRMVIPKLHLDKIVVQGVELVQLDRAPGHFPQTPFPGQAGNAAIAGHRTTYGAPFYNIDKLKPGDKIIITTVQGTFTYSVQWTKIVMPDAMWVLKTAKDHPNTLTLSACHPRLNLTRRYIVRAVLQGKPAPRMAGQEAAMRKASTHAGDTIAGGVESPSNSGAWLPMIAWGLVCAGVWILTWWASRRWRREGGALPRWVRTVVPYVIGVPVFLGTLFLCFENLAQLLPAGL